MGYSKLTFDTAYQNTGLSEGQGLRPYNPKKRHKAQSTHRGDVVVPPLWKRKKRELFSSLFSLSLRQSLGHTSVLSERVSSEKSAILKPLIVLISRSSY